MSDVILGYMAKIAPKIEDAATDVGAGLRSAAVRQYPFGGVLWDIDSGGFRFTRNGQVLLAGLALYGAFKIMGGR